jgi:hypothetical protein
VRGKSIEGFGHGPLTVRPLVIVGALLVGPTTGIVPLGSRNPNALMQAGRDVHDYPLDRLVRPNSRLNFRHDPHSSK